MHVRLAERRDVIQAERWENLARSIERTSDKVTRILSNSESIAAHRLIARLLVLRHHLFENEYSSAHLNAAVAMVDDVTISLHQLVVEVGAAQKPPVPQALSANGPP